MSDLRETADYVIQVADSPRLAKYRAGVLAVAAETAARNETKQERRANCVSPITTSECGRFLTTN